MNSIKKRHEDFIKELQAPLRASSNYRTKNEEDIENMKLMEELERKFDELFDDIDDDD